MSTRDECKKQRPASLRACACLKQDDTNNAWQLSRKPRNQQLTEVQRHEEQVTAAPTHTSSSYPATAEKTLALAFYDLLAPPPTRQ